MDFINSPKLICFLAKRPKLRRLAHWFISKIIKPTHDQLLDIYVSYLTDDQASFGLMDFRYLNIDLENIYIDDVENYIKAFYGAELLDCFLDRCLHSHLLKGEALHRFQ